MIKSFVEVTKLSTEEEQNTKRNTTLKEMAPDAAFDFSQGEIDENVLNFIRTNDFFGLLKEMNHEAKKQNVL